MGVEVSIEAISIGVKGGLKIRVGRLVYNLSYSIYYRLTYVHLQKLIFLIHFPRRLMGW